MLLVLLRIWMAMCLGIREATFGRHDPTPSHLKKASLGTHMRAIIGEPSWLETADVSDDGIINFLDIKLVALDVSNAN